MSNVRRAVILKLSAAAYEMNLEVANGLVTRDEDGRWLIGGRDLDAWLAEHEGHEVAIIIGSLEDEQPVQTRTCRTCGRDYTDFECPYCRASRIRLRGAP
jgi:RNA:NAD 2'-phosphotransferase (TPT1/KptA family)